MEWRRRDRDLQDKVYFRSDGLFLVIPDVDYDDAGAYECSAINVNGGIPTRKTIRLEVECEHCSVSKLLNLCTNRVFHKLTTSQYWHCCELCISIYLLFPSSFATCNVSKFEMRYQ